jgi:3',5'-cyclic-AMP phosphodiesterase
MKVIIQKICFTSVFLSLFLFTCTTNQDTIKTDTKSDEFSFAFMTDIHIRPDHRYAHLPQESENSPLAAFSMAIDTANQLGVDFVITGGDLVFDVLRGQVNADSLFQMYANAIKAFEMPVYNVIGNHDLYGIYPGSNISPEDPDYNYGMYERYLGDTYYSFEHKGWHFIALNSVDDGNGRYTRTIHEEQMSWLQELLTDIDKDTPIVIALHIPLVSVRNQIHPGDRENPEPYPAVRNRNDLLDMFENHNLKLVLQGHIHWVEEIYVQDIDTWFISGGAIAGRPTWRGFRHGPPGFLVFNVKDGSVSWDFIDYGWMERLGKYAGWESPRPEELNATQ